RLCPYGPTWPWTARTEPCVPQQRAFGWLAGTLQAFPNTTYRCGAVFELVDRRHAGQAVPDLDQALGRPLGRPIGQFGSSAEALSFAGNICRRGVGGDVVVGIDSECRQFECSFGTVLPWSRHSSLQSAAQASEIVAESFIAKE